MKKIYEGITIHKCIDQACKDLGISREKLKYEVVEQKKSFFKKKIAVETENENGNDSLNVRSNADGHTDENEMQKPFNADDGTVKSYDGKLIIKDPKNNGQPACIIVKNNINVVVDEKKVDKEAYVYEKNDIKIGFNEQEASRELKIETSQDKMKVYGTIIYKPKIIYKLKDKDESNHLVLEAEEKSKIDPPKYTVEEIKRELSNNNINYGILEKNIEEFVQNTRKNYLIARGTEKSDGVDDFIETKFKTDENTKQLKEDKLGNIDFKSIGSVQAVEKGDVIAIKHPGKDGVDGKNVAGKLIKHKPRKMIKLSTGTGCIIKDNTVVSLMYGKPCIKGKSFYVYQLHEVKTDVDLKTGNIKFIGDIIIYGSVREGMMVECGNSLVVERDVERANIKAKGNIDIKGNVIASKIFSGGEDVNKLKCIEELTKLKEILSNLVLAVEEIKRYDLLGHDKKDGQIIKILIENKFKALPRICLNIITNFKINENEFEGEDLIQLLRDKLLGISPINIKNYGELDLILNCIEQKSQLLKDSLSIPVNVNVSYCQDSNISSSGDVVITGKGEYISNIDANGKIDFVQERSVARGGLLKAKDEIKCRVVGSVAGVPTKLQVEKDGNIWADEAYQNTIFIVGQREFILDIPSKNIHAYLDDKGDILVDKFVL